MPLDIIQGEQRSWAETPPMNPPLRHAIGEVVERQTWLDKAVRVRDGKIELRRLEHA